MLLFWWLLALGWSLGLQFGLTALGLYCREAWQGHAGKVYCGNACLRPVCLDAEECSWGLTSGRDAVPNWSKQ